MLPVGRSFDENLQDVMQSLGSFEIEPPTKSAISLTGKMFDIEAKYRFEDLNGCTRVTQESTVSGKGFVKIMFFLFGWFMNKQGCRAVSNELESLKKKLEDGAGQATS